MKFRKLRFPFAIHSLFIFKIQTNRVVGSHTEVHLLICKAITTNGGGSGFATPAERYTKENVSPIIPQALRKVVIIASVHHSL